MRFFPRLAAAFVLLALLIITPRQARSADARTVHKQIGVHAGLCVLLGNNPIERALALAKVSDLVIYVPTRTHAEATTIRAAAEKAGLLGTRIYVDHGRSQRIGLASNLADAVVVEGPIRTPAAELMRVIRPRGRLVVDGQVRVKPVPEGTGEWSHPYHGSDNNPQSDDRLARAPYLTKFLATPWYGPMPEVTVSSGGRMFKAFGFLAFKRREWPMVGKLICLNGYNGATLWTRLLTPGFMIHRNTIVATPDTLYLADNTSCKLIDAATGAVRGEGLVFTPPGGGDGAKHIVLVAGDQEYRTEESMPMLAKVLSVKHGFKCTVVFSYSEDGSYIDPNNEHGLKGLSALDSADLMLIGTRFRRPSVAEAAHITKFLNDGKSVIGIRTATHAFTGSRALMALRWHSVSTGLKTFQ